MKKSFLKKTSLFLFFILPLSLWGQKSAYQNSNPNIKDDGKAVKLEFKYQKDDSYRIHSTVDEDVYVNTKFDHSSTIVNRVSVKVKEVNGKSALHDVTFMTSEESSMAVSGKTYSWGKEYQSFLTKNNLGVYTIDEEYFMPTVRDVPTFPDKKVKAGDTWTADGQEAHDLRQGFGLEKPYIVPFTAKYTYKGYVEEDGKRLEVIQCTYNLYMESPEYTNTSPYYIEYPVMTMGFSDEEIYFDNEKGMISHYTEKFRIIMETVYGGIYEFTGTAHSEVSDLVRTATEEGVKNVQEKIENLGLENVTVTKGEKGLTIALEKIQFEAESALLKKEEQEKIKKISEILKLYPDNDILVVGHTALSGTAKSRQSLSEERAQAVANYLIKLGVKDKYHIFTQGMGSLQPLADNYKADGSPDREGMARNRRVEIIILDK